MAVQPADATVPVDAAPADEADDPLRRAIGAVPGLTLATALKVTSGKVDRLARFLEKFRIEHAGDAHAIEALLAAGEREDARRVAHTLKGLAGTFGLGDLQACATRLDAAIKSGEREVEPLVEECRKTLDVVMAGLADLQQTTKAHPVEAGSIDWPQLRDGLETLRVHLDGAEMTATRDFEALQPGLTAVIGARAETLAHQIEEFEFDEALATLTAILAEEPRLRSQHAGEQQERS